MVVSSRTLELGALCDPVSKQLAGLLPDEDLRRFDKMANAITECYVQGLILDRESDFARRRLLKKIQQAVASKR